MVRLSLRSGVGDDKKIACVSGHYFKVNRVFSRSGVDLNYGRRIIHVSQTWASILGRNCWGNSPMQRAKRVECRFLPSTGDRDSSLRVEYRRRIAAACRCVRGD